MKLQKLEGGITELKEDQKAEFRNGLEKLMREINPLQRDVKDLTVNVAVINGKLQYLEKVSIAAHWMDDQPEFIA